MRILRSLTAIRDILLEEFSPSEPPWGFGPPMYAGRQAIDGALDGCSRLAAPQGLRPFHPAASAMCRVYGYAADYPTKPNAMYCTLPIEQVPTWVQAQTVKDADGTYWRVCPYRCVAWKPGKPFSLPRKRTAHYWPREVRLLVRDTALRELGKTSVHAATLKGLIHDDWTEVDSDPAKHAWRQAENARRSRYGESALDDAEARNGWRVHRQERTFAEIGRQARRRT